MLDLEWKVSEYVMLTQKLLPFQILWQADGFGIILQYAGLLSHCKSHPINNIKEFL